MLAFFSPEQRITLTGGWGWSTSRCRPGCLSFDFSLHAPFQREGDIHDRICSCCWHFNAYIFPIASLNISFHFYENICCHALCPTKSILSRKTECRYGDGASEGPGNGKLSLLHEDRKLLYRLKPNSDHPIYLWYAMKTALAETCYHSDFAIRLLKIRTAMLTYQIALI